MRVVTAFVLVVVLAPARGQPAAQPPDRPGIDQSGRQRFLVEHLPLALGWYGTAGVLLEWPEGTGTKVVAYIAGSTLGYAVPLLATMRLPMSDAQAHFSIAFAYRGLLAGHSLDAILKFGSVPHHGLGLLVGSVCGEAGGYLAARRLDIGRAALITSYVDFGILNGLFAGTIVNTMVFNQSLSDASPSVGILPGEVVGGIWGVCRARTWRCSEGQATVVRAAGILGAAVPGCVYFAARGKFDNSDQTAVSALGIAANVAAVCLVERLVRRTQLAASDGYAVAGGTIGGALAGAGIGRAGWGRRGALRAALGGGAVGAVAGFVGGLCVEEHRAGQPGRTDLRRRLDLDYTALLAAVAAYGRERSFCAPGLVRVRF